MTSHRTSLALCAVPFLLMPMLFHETLQRHFDNVNEDGDDNNNQIGANESGGRNVFSCYTCNVQTGQADNDGPCIDTATECPTGSVLGQPVAPFNSCSTLLQFPDSNQRPPAQLQMAGAVASAFSGRAHVRKFCTSAGTGAELLAPLLTRLAENGGAAGVCQSLDSWARLSADPLLPFIVEGTARAHLLTPVPQHNKSGEQRRRGTGVPGPTTGEQQQQQRHLLPSRRRYVRTAAAAGPPAPPTSQQTSSSILCVCTKSLCNEDDFEHILSRSIYIGGME